MWPFRKRKSEVERQREFLNMIIRDVTYGQIQELKLEPPKPEAKVLRIVERVLKEVNRR